MKVVVKFTAKIGQRLESVRELIEAESVDTVKQVQTDLVKTILEERFKSKKKVKVFSISVTGLGKESNGTKRGPGRPVGSKNKKKEEDKGKHRRNDPPISIKELAEKMYFGLKYRTSTVGKIFGKYTLEQFTNHLRAVDKNYYHVYNDYKANDFLNILMPTVHLDDGVEPTLDNLRVITRRDINKINSDKVKPKREAALAKKRRAKDVVLSGVNQALETIELENKKWIDPLINKPGNNGDALQN